MSLRVAILFVSGVFLGVGCKDQEGGYSCFPGNEECPCVAGACLAGLQCVKNTCKPIGEPEGSESSGSGSGTGTGDTDPTEGSGTEPTSG
jgi:hypothetical protein